ncbi:glycosyltransferase family 2 protein [Nocardioides gilvus]|uniref:glycosyltransferase family 2 protein n=1 Tax=Nocardioides gilvus TaxID=1735589 RepID=UPI000D743B23|nr:galactosyltransferase-related protein [Nocardioides gilvus]
MTARTAVVTIAHGRHDHLARQQQALAACAGPAPDYVVVAMDDPWVATWVPTSGPVPTVLSVPSHRDGLPLAQARNAGARAALERGADILVFLDVDCLPGRGLVRGYTTAVREEPGVVWSGPVTYLPRSATAPTPGSEPAPGALDLTDLARWDDPHPARPAPGPGERTRGGDPNLFWSLSFALSPQMWQATGGFCEEYVGYGGEDTDFARLVVTAGADLGWTGDARAYHQYHQTESPPVRHLEAILRNGRTFADRWGTWPMLGWLEEFERAGLVRRNEDGWEPTSPDGSRRQ